MAIGGIATYKEFTQVYTTLQGIRRKLFFKFFCWVD